MSTREALARQERFPALARYRKRVATLADCLPSPRIGKRAPCRNLALDSRIPGVGWVGGWGGELPNAPPALQRFCNAKIRKGSIGIPTIEEPVRRRMSPFSAR